MTHTNIMFLWLCRLVTRCCVHNGVSAVFTRFQKQVQPQGAHAWCSWRWSRSILLSSLWEAGEKQKLPAGSPISTPSGSQKHSPFSCRIAQDPTADKHIGCETIFMLPLLYRTGLLETKFGVVSSLIYSGIISQRLWGMFSPLKNVNEYYVHNC